jgi:transcription elongation factor Elf1
MASTSTDDGDYLRFGCPRCGHVARDEYETLEALTPTEWRCDHCARVFNVLLLDCLHCGYESTSVALIAAEQPPPQYLVCPSCQRAAVDHEEVDDRIF